MPRILTWSPSITVPLTHDCPWRCTYCGYRSDNQGLIAPDEFERLLGIAVQRGLTEVLFLAGEAPDSLPHLRAELRRRGFLDFTAFTRWACERALGLDLLPHTNIGALSRSQLLRLADVNASMGLMLENSDEAFNRTVAPKKSAAGRIRTLDLAGSLGIPFTSGILIGLGESRESRLASLDVLAGIHARHGHLQEIILQNYIPNTGSKLRPPPPPTFEEYVELIDHWRRIAPDVAVQIPPNINPHWRRLLPLVDDLGGISPEADLVNFETPWAAPEEYAEACREAGAELRHRWPVHARFLDPRWVRPRVLAVLESRRPRPHSPACPAIIVAPRPDTVLERAAAGHGLSIPDALRLAQADGSADAEIAMAADTLNRALNGETVGYVVNRNANFTNVCTTNCSFCGFYRPPGHPEAYTRSIETVVERVLQTPWVTEVCIQGGIHPDLGLDYYVDLLRALRGALPGIHLHAYSPMEIHSLHLKTDLPYTDLLGRLRDAGLGSIPGTAAEILDDRVRGRLSPGKLDSARWIEIVGAAHEAGLPSTATVLFGHGESWEDILVHMDRLRTLQSATGRFTEFIPLAFVPHRNRLGSELSRSLGIDTATLAARASDRIRRLYPLARLFLGPAFRNLQTSWVKLGPEESARMLRRGCNDFGGTLYEESITRGSGGRFGECLHPPEIEAAIRSAGRTPSRRNTLYQPVAPAPVPIPA